MGSDATLEGLIAKFAKAEPAERISFRDDVLAFGAAAIEPLVQVAGRDPSLDASVASWLANLAQRDPSTTGAVARALRGLAASNGSEIVRRVLEQVDGASAASSGNKARHRFDVDPLPAAAGSGWPGFQPKDFAGIAGTKWRVRDGVDSLAPLLVRALRYRHPHVMSFGVQRAPELHLALTDRYRLGDEPESGWRAAKLIVYAHGPTEIDPSAASEVVAGLYAEKGSSADAKRFGIMDDRAWDWPWLVRSLTNPHTQHELARAMVRHDLAFGDYVGGRIRSESDRVGFVARMDEGALVIKDRNGHKSTGFHELAARLEALPDAEWHSVHCWRTWPASEAIEAGPRFATTALLPVLGDLFDVYLDVVGPNLE